MELRSPAFADGEPIPKQYTCDGEDVSPPIEWSASPAGTRSLALSLDDPDAGRYPFTHWLAWGLPAAAGSLPEGKPPPQEGRNDFGASGYRGPCPPPGKPHRYVFRLYALDTEAELEPGVDRRRSFDEAIAGHVLGSRELTGLYER